MRLIMQTCAQLEDSPFVSSADNELSEDASSSSSDVELFWSLYRDCSNSTKPNPKNTLPSKPE
ncbi:hypothetical protein HJC23_007038 [Cyclotella cryptica]|uniref:Uncharacterized protein n=1 Tax=Cyclotella cryptica TaxID=29204 RepID=A0ABD3QM73_9STRA